MVVLHYVNSGINPLSLRKISAILRVPKSSCAQIYKRALQNAAEKRLVQTEATIERLAAERSISLGADLDREGRGTKCDIVFAGLDAQFDSLYTMLVVRTAHGEPSADEAQEKYIQAKHKKSCCFGPSAPH